MDVTYGIKVKSMDNKYVEIAEKATDTIAQAAIPGKFLVDIIPIRTYHLNRFPAGLSCLLSEICSFLVTRRWFQAYINNLARAQ